MLGELVYDLKGGEGACKPGLRFVLLEGRIARGYAGASEAGAIGDGSGTYLPLAIDALSIASGECDRGTAK